MSKDSHFTGQQYFQILSYFDLRWDNSVDAITSTITDIVSSDINEAKDFVVLASSTGLLRKIDHLYRQKTNQQTELTFISSEVLERLKLIHHVVDERHGGWKFENDWKALEQARKQLFTTDKHCIKLSTIHSFKGWEAPHVIVILERDYLIPNTTYRSMSPQVVYTAITRARESLYIINIGNDLYHDFFYNQA